MYRAVCIVLLYLEQSQVPRRNSVIAVRGRKQIFQQIKAFSIIHFFHIPDRKLIYGAALVEKSLSHPGLLLSGETLTQVTWKKPREINQSSSARITVP